MYLGIDIGTSSAKAVLIDGDQNVIASESAALSVSRPQSGWSEQDPLSWLETCTRILDKLADEHRTAMSNVKGIGLSGQMHGATLLDAADRPLRPCILWNDGRSEKEAQALSEASERITGNIAMPGFTAPKLLWVARHEPRVFERIRSVLLPKDYVRLWLTGDKVSDMSDAAGTLWLATESRDWSDEMLGRTGLDPTQMPRLVEGTEVSGTLRPALAKRWGMSPSTVVAGGGGDNAASGCGVGAVAPGTGFISIGTSGVVFVSADRYRANPKGAVHTFCHAVPATWHQMSVALSAAGSLDWICDIVGASAGDLIGELGPRPGGPGTIGFLPYLSGERTPHNDAAVRGAFLGLDRSHGRSDLAQAVLEGVAFSFKDCLDVLTMPLAEPAQLLAVGGGTRSRYWLSLIATVLNLPITVPASSEAGAALGAARLGLIAAEMADPLSVCRQPPVGDTIEPIAELVDSYANAYARFRRLYPAIRNCS